MKVISVPLTQEAMYRVDLDQSLEGDLKELTLSDSEFSVLWSSGVLDDLNEELDLLIGDFEDESITGERLEQALAITQQNKHYLHTSVVNALASQLELAISKSTGVFFFF
ncbi:hypothetical protein [Zooshikella harenae]|uniref:Uncharacterized protein n=1 Tax=Zooshikella harenae TaxID=2827238 RepID=A0ABS5ZJ51_9GAMM|nr:hypothetical protein [Zooshikella harenae]MBU2713960.1 hypothetical protein [Zooshikella harenae]